MRVMLSDKQAQMLFSGILESSADGYFFQIVLAIYMEMK